MKLIDKVLDYIRHNTEASLLMTGALLSKQQLNLTSTAINDYEFKVFSQWGDDGIIQYLVRNIAIQNTTFIEFGVESFLEANTRFLMMHNNWSGFVMDGSTRNMNKLRAQRWFWKYDLTCKDVFINKDNINALLKESHFKDLGLLHIDIDGNDYHILETIDMDWLNPSIIIMEYNSMLGNERPITTIYDKDFVRTKAHYSNIVYGASLPALVHLAEQKGYALVGCNLAGNNAYFVRNDLLNEQVKKVSTQEGYRESKFRESRHKNGALTYFNKAQNLELIKGIPVLNVISKEVESL
ncbi:MAG: hypothetical protein ACRBFS_16685 [Aureispira sp.]